MGQCTFWVLGLVGFWASLVSCAHRESLVPIDDESGLEVGQAAGTPAVTVDSLNASHGKHLSEAWSKNKIPLENFSKILTGASEKRNTSPLSWVKQGNTGWIFHYGNPAANTNKLKTSDWFKSRFNAKKNAATMAGPGVYFSRNAYTSASFGWDIFAFPVKLDPVGSAARCISFQPFFSSESSQMFEHIGAKSVWPSQWSSLFAGDLMAATAAVQQFPEKYDSGLVAWAQPFVCLDYSPSVEWLLLTNSRILSDSMAPPAMDDTTFPAIIEGLDLAETKSNGISGIGGRFLAFIRILTARPYVNAPFPAHQSSDKKGQLPFLGTKFSIRESAQKWFAKNPQSLAEIASYTRKILPKMSDADIAKSGVATFAAAWNQMVFEKKLSNDDLLSFVKQCLETKCP